jgi:hypothetical protein
LQKPISVARWLYGRSNDPDNARGAVAVSGADVELQGHQDGVLGEARDLIAGSRAMLSLRRSFAGAAAIGAGGSTIDARVL